MGEESGKGEINKAELSSMDKVFSVDMMSWPFCFVERAFLFPGSCSPLTNSFTL
jgi:hypothetical protein